MKQYSQRRRERERGFALLFVFLLAAVLALGLYREMPRVAFESQRLREEMLIDRGLQYRRAIQLYVRREKRYPASMDQLEKTQDRRYLRRRYIDPMTGKDEWRLIHIDGNGRFTDSLIQPQSQQQGQWQNSFISEGPTTGSTGAQGGTGGATIANRLRQSDLAGAPGQGGEEIQGGAPGEIPPQTQPSQEGIGGMLQLPQPGAPGNPQQQSYPNQSGYPNQPGYPNSQQQFPGREGFPGQPGFPQGVPAPQNFPQTFPQQQQGQPASVPPILNILSGPQQQQMLQQQLVRVQQEVQRLQQLEQMQQITPQQQQQLQQQLQQLTLLQQTLQRQGVNTGDPIQPYDPTRQTSSGAPPFSPVQPGNPNPFGGQNPPGGFGGQNPAQPPGFGQPQPPANVPPGGLLSQNSQAQQQIMNMLTRPNPRGGAGGAAGAQQGFSLGGGGIAGVATTFEAEGIKVFADRTVYNEWEFLYDFSRDPVLMGGGVNLNPGGQTPQTPNPLGPTPQQPQTPNLFNNPLGNLPQTPGRPNTGGR